MSCTTEFTSHSDSPATHDSLTIANLQLRFLVSFLPLTIRDVTLAFFTRSDSSFCQGSIMLIRVVGLTAINAVPVTVNSITTGNNPRTFIVLRVPPAVSEVISIRGRPLMDPLCRGFLLLLIPVWVCLVFRSIKRHGRSVRHLFTLCMVLNDFPVFFN